jgi:hypothetical protein
MLLYLGRPTKHKNKTSFIQNPKDEMWPKKLHYLKGDKSSDLKVKYLESKIETKN